MKSDQNSQHPRDGRAQELFAGEQVTTVPLVKLADWGTDDLIRRRRAAQQELAGGWYPES